MSINYKFLNQILTFCYALNCLSILLLVTSCSQAPESALRRTKTQSELHLEECSTVSFGNLDVCSDCVNPGECALNLPQLCTVKIIHYNSSESIIEEYDNIAMKRFVLSHSTIDRDFIVIYSSDRAQKICRIEEEFI